MGLFYKFFIHLSDLNKVIPASAYVSSNSLEPVKLRITDKEYANNSPKSIPYLFHQVVQRIPNVTAMGMLISSYLSGHKSYFVKVFPLNC